MDTKSDNRDKLYFHCEFCDYYTSHRGHWKKHLGTSKHVYNIMLSNITNLAQKMTTPYSNHVCYCGKQYFQSTSLSRHKAKCKFLEEKLQKVEKSGKTHTLPPKTDHSTLNEKLETENLGSVVIDKKTYELMEENSRLKDNMITVLQHKPNIVSTGNNATINTLNINVYLDEKYKDAMNIDDFVQNIKYSVDDLQTTATHGYVKGVSNIFLKNLQVLDPKSRPIHCGDLKGTQIYIRDANKWEKDGGKLTTQIDNVAKRQINMISEWENLHPDWHKDEKLTHQYLNMVRQLTAADKNGGNEEIKRNLAKNVVLEELIDCKL